LTEANAGEGTDIRNASLDPLHPQSQYADYLLGVFQDVVRKDPDYVARLARHYEMFKRTEPPQPELFVPKTAYNARSGVGRNDPCPCGSGKKYKKCCGK
jgi:preprotein translocase subunit SecA